MMIETLRQTFSAAFDSSPAFGVRAPGRINLIGEHIDYLDGFVMPMVIDRAIYSLIAPNDSADIRIWTSVTDGVTTLSISDAEVRTGDQSWLNYPVGVLSVYRETGIECPGFDIAIDTDLPTGAGLSSSAALETTFALVIEKLSGRSLDKVERAKVCQRAEHEYAGVPCGIMDQMAVGACESGQALMIDCRSLELNPISIPEGIAIVVSDTRVKHALGDGEYKRRRDDCEAALSLLAENSWRDVTMETICDHRDKLGETLFRRARHAVTEISRVTEFAAALQSNNRIAMGEILKAGHASLRDDYEVSCPELDHLVETAYELGAGKGVIGARMTGGGFGGSTITLVEEKSAGELIDHLTSAFQSAFGKTIEPFVTPPSKGAEIIDP